VFHQQNKKLSNTSNFHRREIIFKINSEIGKKIARYTFIK